MVGACDWPSHQQVWAGYNTKTKHSPTLIFLGEQITVAHNIRTFSVDVNSPPSSLVNSERYGVGLGDRWAYYTHTHTHGRRPKGWQICSEWQQHYCGEVDSYIRTFTCIIGRIKFQHGIRSAKHLVHRVQNAYGGSNTHNYFVEKVR